MNRFACLVVAGLSLCAAPLMAADSVPMLEYDGKPIDALCIDQLMPWEKQEDVPTVNLAECGVRTKNISVIEDSGWSYFPDNGFTGTEYMESEGGRGSYAFYKDLGDADGARLLWVERSGGGSGKFSDIIMISRAGDTLTLQQSLLSGDRCNNGIASAELKDGHLITEQNITPAELIRLAGNTKLKASALEDSASSCIGTVVGIDGQGWTHVRLSEKDDAFTDVEGFSERFTYQSCFNKLMNETVRKGKTLLDKKDLQALSARFSSKCVKPQKTVSNAPHPKTH